MTQLPPAASSPMPEGDRPQPVVTSAPQVIVVPPPPRRAGLIIVTILLIGSVLMNFVMMLFVAISGLAAMTGGGAVPGKLKEVVIEKGPAANKIAVISIEGVITEQPMGSLFAASGTDLSFVKKQVKQAIEDATVKAVVLEVNSPGGGAAASDLMYHELLRLRTAQKPVVVHMGSVAASGGYYVSMAGDHIVAQRTCITGSIGVIGQLMTMRQMMEDKLGIQVHTLTSGPMKGVGNPFTDLTPENEQYLMNTMIMPMYNQFVAVVKEGRPKLSEERIRTLADGRAYSAQQALEDGLIDQIGFFEEAIAEARKRAGLSSARVIQYKRESGLFEMLSASEQARSDSLMKITPDVLNAWTTPQVMMLWRGQ